MKKYTGLVALTLLLWGCNDNATSPSPEDQEATYGSSVITLPALGLAKKAAGPAIQYKFQLTITGSNMDPMKFNWDVDGSGSKFTINRIPSGYSRVFEGILSGSDRSTYEGKVSVDIYGGQVANVSLVLQKTGSAQVEVIIDDIPKSQLFTGCYDVKGNIESIDISDLTIEIPSSPSDNFGAYFKKDNEIIGKFWGYVSGNTISGTISLPPFNMYAKYNGVISIDNTQFKGQIISIQNDKKIGAMSGKSISCNSIPEKCTEDTLGGTGSCKDTTTWIKYAEEQCASQGRILTNFYFQSNCDSIDMSFFETIIFTSCLPKK